MSTLNGYLEELRDIIEKSKRLFHETENKLPQRLKMWDNLSESKEVSRLLRAIPYLGKLEEYQYITIQSLFLSILHLYSAFATHIQYLEDSGILEKVKGIEDTKKELKKILESIKEDVKRVEESRQKNLSYIE